MIAHHETSKNAQPPAALVASIARALGVSADELLGLEPLKEETASASVRLRKRLLKAEELAPTDQKRCSASWTRSLMHAKLPENEKPGHRWSGSPVSLLRFCTAAGSAPGMPGSLALGTGRDCSLRSLAHNAHGYAHSPSSTPPLRGCALYISILCKPAADKCLEHESPAKAGPPALPLARRCQNFLMK